jgi:cytochrome c2
MQGLLVDRDERIWTTEHGPQGGDELNLIVEGGNFGYPLAVYGTSYTSKDWPSAERVGFHDGYVEPAFAWLPSVGLSNLVQVTGFYPAWESDLLIATLKTQSLLRVRIRNDRVVFVEAIRFGDRIRDIDQLGNGSIVTWSDSGVLSILTPATTDPSSSHDAVEVALSDLEAPLRNEVSEAIESCRVCHSVSPTGTSEGAPNLSGVYGRQIAGSEYENYSEALQARRGVWDAERLDAYLRNPREFAEGTTMVIAPISDPKVRAGLIEYLKLL